MASFIKAGFGHDLIDLAEALEAVEHGLSDELRKVTTDKAQPLVGEVKRLMPYDPAHRGWRGRHKRRDPGHIRDSVEAVFDRRGLAIRTTHPGGPVHWWGGTIAPRDAEIAISSPAGAGENFTTRKADELGRDIDDAIGRLLAEHGL